MTYKNAIILDIDETLVHTTEGVHKTPDSFILNFSAEHKMTVQRRPGLKKFLKYLFDNFHLVAFWTAATEDYAKEVLKHIIPKKMRSRVRFLLSRDTLFDSEYGPIKDLRFLWLNQQFSSMGIYPHNTIFIDDKQENALSTPGNLFRVKPYVGGGDDDVLYQIMSYFHVLFGDSKGSTYLYLDSDGPTIVF